MAGEWLEYKQSIVDVMAQDHYRLQRRLSEIEKLARALKPYEQALDKWQQQLVTSQANVARRQLLIPTVINFPNLPICDKREEIAAIIATNQVEIGRASCRERV